MQGWLRRDSVVVIDLVAAGAAKIIGFDLEIPSVAEATLIFRHYGAAEAAPLQNDEF